MEENTETEVIDENDSSALYDKLVLQAINETQPRLHEEEMVPDEVADEVETVEPAAEVAKVEVVPTELDRTVAREAAVAAKEKELEAKLAEFKRAQSPNPDLLSVSELKKLAETDVPGVFAKFGLDKDHIMDVLIAEKLGDKAPPALKEKLRDYNLKREIESIRSERDNERRVSSAREYYQRVSGEAREYVTAGLDEKVAPTVSMVSKAKPDLVHSLVLSELDRDAREKVAKGETDGALLTYAEAVAKIESLFSVVAAAVKDANTVKTTSTKTVAGKTPPPITRQKDNKPVDEVAELEAKGRDTFMRTFQREEAKRRRQVYFARI